jgi:ribosomal protein L23
MVTVDGVEVGFWVDGNDVAHIECEKGNVVEIDFTVEGTQINTMNAEAKSGKIYTLDGREVKQSEQLAKGVYIADGKKMLKK